MASQCLLFTHGYIMLCAAFFLLARMYSPRSLLFLLLYMWPVVFLLCWVQLQRQNAEEPFEQFEALFFALMLITFARCASHFHVVLLAELAWICSVGVLIGARFCLALLRGLVPGTLPVLGLVLISSFGMGIWLLYIATEVKHGPKDHLLWKNWVNQFQTTITRILILAELSILVTLGLAQLLANPTQNTLMAEFAAILLYTSAILTDATNRFCPLTKEAMSNTYYLLIHAALLLETASVIC